MKKIVTNSSMIKSLEYNKGNRIMTIEFINSEIYRYYDIDESVYNDFVGAKSKGSFFTQNIRDKFVTENITDLSGAFRWPFPTNKKP